MPVTADGDVPPLEGLGPGTELDPSVIERSDPTVRLSET